MAHRVGRLAERVHSKLEPKYKSGATKTHVTIVMNSDLVNAFASPYGLDRIFLFLESPAPGEFSRFDLWVDTLFTHEYTHILTLRYYETPSQWALRIVFGIPPNLIGPQGMAEGYAVYEESQKGLGRLHDPLTKMILRTAVLEDTFPSAAEAMSGSHRWPHGQIYYLYGANVVDYLHRKYPEGAANFWRAEAPPVLLDQKLRSVQIRSYSSIYREFRKEKFEEINGEIAKLRALGLTPFDRLTLDGEYKEHLTPGTTGLLYFSRPGARPPGYYRFLADSKDKPEYIKRVISSAGISEAGGVSVSSEDYFFYPGLGIRQELYDTNRTRFLRRLLPGSSVVDPALSPDGQTLYYIEKTAVERTVKRANYSNGIEGEPTEIYKVPFTGILRFTTVSPDHRFLAFVARKGEVGRAGLVLCDLSKGQDAGSCKTIAAGAGSIVRPRFSPDSKTIYFSSDADGIYNVYSINIDSGLIEQRTRTLTGLFDPVPIDDSLFALGYFGNGYDIVRMRNADLIAEKSDLFQPRAEESNSFFEEENPIPAGSPVAQPTSDLAKDPPYHGVLSIRPYFTGLLIGSSLINLGLGATDPLGRHTIFAGISPGIPDPYAVAYYDYARFILNFSAFYSTNYWKRDRAPGCLFPDDPARFVCDDKYSFTEEGGGYLRYTDDGRFFSYQILPGYVTYKIRNARRIRITEYDARDLNLSGPSLVLIAGGTDYYAESISPETGWRFILQSEYFTKDTSKRELDPRAYTPIEYGQAEGGLALYLPSFWDHHVNYLSAYGYTSYGPDREIQKVRLSRFQRGIAYDRSPTGLSTSLFTYEYRLPLIWLSQSLEGSPDFALRGVGMGIFAETGTAFDRVMYRDQFQSSVGLSFLFNVNFLYLPLAPIRISISRGLGKVGETQFSFSISTGFGSQVDGRSDAVTRPWHRSLPRMREQPGYFRNPDAGGVLE